MPVHKIQINEIDEGEIEAYVGDDCVEIYVKSQDRNIQTLAILSFEQWKFFTKLVNKSVREIKADTVNPKSEEVR